MYNIIKKSWLAVFVGLLTIGCSEEDTTVTPPRNQAPTIAFTFPKLAVARNSSVTLSVDVDDADGDPVQVTWDVTRWLLEAGDQGTPSMRCEAAATVGTDTVTVTATDGKGGVVTLTRTVDVASPTDDVTANLTWSAGGSPYIVAPAGGIFAVNASATLTIDPGVNVYVEPNSEIQVSGRVDGNGMATAPIFIRPNMRTPEPGCWSGILTTPSAASVLEFDHTHISYAQNALRSSISGSILATNCFITFCSEAAVLYESNGQLLVDSCTITDNLKSGVRVSESTIPPASITIRGGDIGLNGRFKDSTLYTDGEAGISIDLNDPNGTVPIDISGNEISRNDFPGIRLITAVFPLITGNGIFGNEFRLPDHINIRLEPPFRGLITTIDATNNYWGSNPADSVLIKEGIFDSEDTGSVDVKVLVTPWLDSWPQ
ncbi:MAG: right-handed parallel beta-helix repeat-containing protein [Candidatus Krumholzibacteria bacterium]|nr:right-handed parallel beta-helix repeat-containing protein [Candidatus Krumholzibacteria bacterium]